MLYSLVEATERRHHKDIRPIDVVASQPVHLLSHCLISTYLPGITTIAVVPSNCSGAVWSRSGTYRRCHGSCYKSTTSVPFRGTELLTYRVACRHQRKYLF